MGLITQEVEIILQGRLVKHYEDLGYEIPRIKNKYNRYTIPIGTKIIVKVQDLPRCSNIYIKVQCDNCGEINNIIWNNYNTRKKEDGKCYCNNCAKNLYAAENARKTKLKNGTSFEQWCIENNRQDILDRWDYELNDYKPSEIAYSANKKYYFKCPRGLHKSELKKICNFTKNEKAIMDCYQCNSIVQWGIDNLGEDFLEKYWDYEKNTVDPWKVSRCSTTIKIYIKCQEVQYHNSYDITPGNFVRNRRCPYCSNRNSKTHYLDSLGKLLEDKNLLHLWSDKNKESPFNYAPKSGKEVYWKCPEGIHEDYPRGIYNSNRLNFRCPECECSQGEESISNYFINIGFIKIVKEDYNLLDDIFKIKYNYYIPQMKFDDLIGLGGGLLSYDFYLPNKQYNFLIEYDGEFHYKPIKKYKNEPIKYAEERLRKQQEHDRLKTEYAKNHNIKLLRIPYWEFDNIENILEDYLNNINNLSVKEAI